MLGSRVLTTLAIICCCSSIAFGQNSANAQTLSNGVQDELPLLLSFSLDNLAGKIQKSKQKGAVATFKISVRFPSEIDLEKLTAEFETQPGTDVFVNGVKQISGITKNDFSQPVSYVLKQGTSITQKYLVHIVFAPAFRTDIDLNIHPSYNTAYGVVNIGFDGDWFIGGKFTNYLFGFDVSDSYFIFNGKSKDKNISGYWNILRGTLMNKFILSKYFGIGAGIGTSWMNSSFEYSGITRYVRNEPGIFLQLDANYSPLKFIRLDLINQFDLFMDPNGLNLYPYYKGGIQLSFLDFISWLRIHFGVSGIYSAYEKEGISSNIGMIVFEAGVDIGLQSPGKNTGLSKGVQRENTAKLGSGIEGLRKAKLNDTITFPEIRFKEDANELTQESLDILADIAEVIIQKKNMEIMIRLFARRNADPVFQLTSSIDKLRIVRDHLVDLGIDTARIHVPSEVSVLDENESDQTILIKIQVLKI